MCKKMMSIASMCACVAVSFCSLNQMATAADLGGVVVVAQDGGGDYTCIQAAIDDYSVTEILVMPGVVKMRSPPWTSTRHCLPQVHTDWASVFNTPMATGATPAGRGSE